LMASITISQLIAFLRYGQFTVFLPSPIQPVSTTGSLNKTLWCRIVLWDHAFPRQAHKRNASRHI
jgi:hypothetical protein